MNVVARSASPMRTRLLLRAVRQRLPAAAPGLRAASGPATAAPVPLADLVPGRFYVFDDLTARAFADAVLELAATEPGGRLVLTCPDPGELTGLDHRLQHLAGRFDRMLVLGRDAPRAAGALATRMDFHGIDGHPLARYRLALRSGDHPVAFVARETAATRRAHPQRVGFFTFDLELIETLDDDIDQARHASRGDLASFRHLQAALRRRRARG